MGGWAPLDPPYGILRAKWGTILLVIKNCTRKILVQRIPVGRYARSERLVLPTTIFMKVLKIRVENYTYNIALTTKKIC